MNHKVGFFITKPIRHQLDNQTTAMIKRDVATLLFPIAAVRPLTIQGNKVVFSEEHSYVENRDWYRTELVGLRARLDGKVDSKLLCALEGVEVRLLENQTEPTWSCGECGFHAAVEHPRRADAG